MTYSGSLTIDQDAVTLALEPYMATVAVQITGTFVGTLLFEGSVDGATWVGLTATQGTTTATSATATGNWRVSVAAYIQFRVRLHPVTSGTAAVTLFASDKEHNVSVTNATALGQATMAASLPVVLASDETVPIKGQSAEVIGQGAGVVTGTNTDLIPSTDVSAYKHFSLQLVGTFSLTLQIQGSNDGTNFTALYIYNSTTPISSGVGSSMTAAGIYEGPIVTRYLRVRCTAFTSNASLAGTLELFASAPTISYNNLNVIATPTTSGGTTNFHLVGAGTTNATNVKASAGQLYGYDIGNSDVGDVWVKFHNTAGTPTAGAGVVRSVYVPHGTRISYHNPEGISFATGIGISTTGAATDADTTAIVANKTTIEIDYK